MFKIYTPQQWFSMFRCAELIIEDDGLIFNEEDYYKTFRQAIGKFDYDSGYIYGEDYHRWGAIPIGKIQQDGNVTKIYGDDYARLSAQPIFYIRDNRIYSADQFYKTFPMEAGYIDGTFAGTTRASSVGSSSNTYTEYSYSGSTGTSSEGGLFSIIGRILDLGFWGIVGVVFVFVLIAFAIYAPFYFMSGAEGTESAQLVICSLAFGAFMSFFTMDEKDPGDLFVKMLMYSILAAFGIDVYNTYQNGNFTKGGLIFALIFGAFIYGLVLVVPCLILSFLLWQIKKLFIKKKYPKKDKK